MKSRFSIQEWVHWSELGGGARWILMVAVVLGGALLTGLVGIKQFRGATSEETLRQADLGWQIATGGGFTTRIKYPQTAAWLQARGQDPAAMDVFPEVDLAPLYPLTIAAVIKVLPAGLRDKLFFTAPGELNGFGGDYLVLAVNIILFWVALFLVFLLTRKLFERGAAWVALLAFAFSVGMWSGAVSITGVPLMLDLLLGIFWVLTGVAHRQEKGEESWLAWCVVGVLAGGMFLCDYPTGVLLPVFAAYAMWVSKGVRRWLAPSLVVASALVVVSPWVVRNVVVTGSPVGLAWEGLATRLGDPTAEPNVVRTTLSAEPPQVSLAKIGNKCLTAIETAFKDKLWSSGGLFLTAFFVAGWLYGFKQPGVNRLRWLAVACMLVLVPAYGAMNSGEGERVPILYLSALVVVFGAGFFVVLADSTLGESRVKWAAAALILVQALPLLHDLLEPRRAHFTYPPYYPGLFVSLRNSFQQAMPGQEFPWMADIPAGAAWYSGCPVWAKTDDLADYYKISLDRPFEALLLSPHTLDKPYFAELAPVKSSAPNLGEWPLVYTGLNTGRFPPTFTLRRTQRLTDNMFILLKAQR